LLEPSQVALHDRHVGHPGGQIVLADIVGPVQQQRDGRGLPGDDLGRLWVDRFLVEDGPVAALLHPPRDLGHRLGRRLAVGGKAGIGRDMLEAAAGGREAESEVATVEDRAVFAPGKSRP